MTHIPGTTPKPISEEFPLCHEQGLILDYKFETGPIITAEQVEKLLRKIYEPNGEAAVLELG